MNALKLLLVPFFMVIGGCSILGGFIGHSIDDKYTTQYAAEGLEIDIAIIESLLSPKSPKTESKIPCEENPKCHIYRNGKWVK